MTPPINHLMLETVYLVVVDHDENDAWKTTNLAVCSTREKAEYLVETYIHGKCRIEEYVIDLYIEGANDAG
jgi:hypothetical protein